MKEIFIFFEVVIFRELISTCCQKLLGGILKVSLLSSFTCSKNLAKSSCGRFQSHLVVLAFFLFSFFFFLACYINPKNIGYIISKSAKM